MLNQTDDDADAQGRLETVEAESRRSWLRLQELVWGPRWDFSRPGLDFTDTSLRTLGSWLRRAATEQTPEHFGVVLRCAGYYFGEVIQHHVRSCWEVHPDGIIGVRIFHEHEEDGHVDLLDVLGAWCDAARRNDGTDENVLLDRWRSVISGGIPVHHRGGGATPGTR